MAPTGVYERTEFHLKALRRASRIAAKLPRTRWQRFWYRHLAKLPKNTSGLREYQKIYHPLTQKQLDALDRGRATCVWLPSKVELWFFRILKKKVRGLLSNCVVSSCGHNYFPDIANPKTKRIIEIDGATWHRDKNRKKRRDRALKKAGWKVLHLCASRQYLRKVEETAVKFLLGEY